MTTPVYITGFEYGVVAPTTNGSGLFDTIVGTPTVQSTIKNTGNYALRLNDTNSVTQVGKNLGTSTYTILRYYVRFASLPSGVGEYVEVLDRALTIGGVNLYLDYIADTQKLKFELYSGGTDGVESTNIIAVNTWYCIDIKAYVGATTWTVDWRIDGVSQTSKTLTGKTATTFVTSLFLGGGSGINAYDFYIDDVVVSHTSADYPIGPGGTEALVPTGDGTHVAGTNTIEDNTGTDIGVTTAFNKINSIPPSATNYIRQAIAGTGNYAEVLFGDIVASHSAIIGAFGILAYTSATTTANNGGCIISKDSFATNTTIWGASGALSDYSDGSTSNLFYKSANLVNVIDDTTVNALKARLGYSSDVSPNPYWIDLIVEVAYTTSNSGITTLDLVSYSTTIYDITILESELIVLDLVSYISTIYDITLLESGILLLDLVSYSTVLNDLTIIESELILLDLVTYSSTIFDINVIESELIPLDLVTYSSTIFDLTTFESAIISLDLVTYSSFLFDITIIENELIQLDLAVYTSTLNNLTVLENELIVLDLVSYSTTLNDIIVLENELITLDLVTYTSVLNNVTILENELIVLDLVSYTSILNAITVLENELIPLDLLTYSTTLYDVIIIESEFTSLDLVTYTTSIYDIDVVESSGGIVLDAVVYSSFINDITIIESEFTSLDLVSYYSSVYDFNIIENERISLDLVGYSSSVYDLMVIENATIELDLVPYSSLLEDLTIIESEFTSLDLVSYSSSVYNLSIMEHEVTLLDLVMFYYLIGDVSFDAVSIIGTAPIERYYTVQEETRYNTVEKEERKIVINKEERKILIY